MSFNDFMIVYSLVYLTVKDNYESKGIEVE